MQAISSEVDAVQPYDGRWAGIANPQLTPGLDYQNGICALASSISGGERLSIVGPILRTKSTGRRRSYCVLSYSIDSNMLRPICPRVSAKKS
jgi:hypothetical protein